MKKTIENKKELEAMEYELRISLISSFIMSFGIDDLFIEDPDLGMKKFFELWKEYRPDFDYDNDIFIGVNDVAKEIGEFKLVLNQCDDAFMEMYLYQAVSIFENMLNDFYHDELMLKYDFSGTKVNAIITSLSTIDKVDWFLQMTIGKSYVGEHGWSVIKPFIDARNFFIHYKPDLLGRLGGIAFQARA
ncbi:hypothetical protein [Cohnella abietis]|uniref:Uncharacterized protein n=1 Tax=Cohnella abietis TaxID=2507935 RepID=A0A3T1DF77_9BACL|nr:hypothetical protein [Cohnella abietis]BBI36749.1 hypothetical protein KCTCHS21_61480 [Cohnella abietis]